MPRLKLTTTINDELLLKARELVTHRGLDGVNDVIEEALRIYFANYTVTVWEKQLSGGWIKKLVVRPDKVTFESIRSRTVKVRYNPSYFTEEVLEVKGWKRTFKMKNA